MSLVLFILTLGISLFVTDLTTLFPLDLLNGLQIPNWIGLTLLVVLVSWCMGE